LQFCICDPHLLQKQKQTICGTVSRTQIKKTATEITEILKVAVILILLYNTESRTVRRKNS
jgi:hypothetical protein